MAEVKTTFGVSEELLRGLAEDCIKSLRGRLPFNPGTDKPLPTISGPDGVPIPVLFAGGGHPSLPELDILRTIQAYAGNQMMGVLDDITPLLKKALRDKFRGDDWRGENEGHDGE